MFNFENKYVPALGAHYSRIIASFKNVGGDFEPNFEKVEGHTYKIRSSQFENWLRTLPLTEDEVRDILEMEENGKMELERNALKFIGKDKPQKNKTEIEVE